MTTETNPTSQSSNPQTNPVTESARSPAIQSFSGPDVHTATSAMGLLQEFVKKENEWQARWFGSNAFQPDIESGDIGESSSGPHASGSAKHLKGKFFFTIPYPYVTGSLHVGHGRTYTIGDVFARFKRMNGYNVLWPMGFHITGTPIIAIADKIKRKDEDTLKLYREYVGHYETGATPEEKAAKVEAKVQSFVDPLAIVSYFSGKIVQDFQSIGFSLDLSRQFTTGDKEYNMFVEWMFHQYQQKGYLVQAAYPLLYCVNDKNAVGEDDIKGGDEEKIEVQKFTAFKHAIQDDRVLQALGLHQGDNAFFVTGTLRSDTAFGITNLFVNPTTEYSLIEISDKESGGKNGLPSPEKWVVSAPAAQKLSLQNKNVRTLKEKILGKAFIGAFALTPTGAKVPVFPASFVNPDNATGIVHSVPAHAPFDYMALEDLKKDKKLLTEFGGVGLEALVNAVSPVIVLRTPGFEFESAKGLCEKLKIMNTREKGKLDKATKEMYMAEFYGGILNDANPAPFTGMKAADAKEKVAEWLVGQAKASWFYESSKPAECRCGGKVVAAVMADQWFLDFNAKGWKDNAYAALKQMKITPESYRKQFEDTFAWLDKRPAARRRGLGTQLPFNKDWIIESLSDSTAYMAFYTLIGNIRKYGLKPEQLTPEFFNFAFLAQGDAKALATQLGLNPSTGAATLDAIRKEFEYWYPNDWRQTATAHVSNHLSFFIFAHAALFRPQHWPKAIGLNEMVIAEGTKMSKSKGNVVSLLDLRKELPSDVYRLYAIATADAASTLDYRKRDAQNLFKAFAKWNANLTGLIALSNRAMGTSATNSAAAPGPAAKWFISKFERCVRDSTTLLEENRLREYALTAFYELNNAFAHFETRASESEKQFVATHCAARWLALLSPLVPHATEELWHQLNEHAPNGPSAVKLDDKTHFLSLSDWPHARTELIDSKVEVEEDFLASVVQDGKAVMELVARKGKRPTQLTLITASAQKHSELTSAIAKAGEPTDLATFLVKEVDVGLRQYAEKNFYAWKNTTEKTYARVDELTVLKTALPYLESQLNVKVTVEREEDSANEKKLRAMPLKPAVSAQ